MLELTKTPRTDGFVEVRAVVPASRAEAVVHAIEEAAEAAVPAEEVFPESTPGSRLRGARGLRGDIKFFCRRAPLQAEPSSRAAFLLSQPRFDCLLGPWPIPPSPTRPRAPGGGAGPRPPEQRWFLSTGKPDNRLIWAIGPRLARSNHRVKDC